MLTEKEDENEKIRDIIFDAIRQVMDDNEIIRSELSGSKELIKDLSFSSLMLAQLILLIQEEVDLEPFSNGFIISDMITIDDYIDVYSRGKL
jgi:acyl carrier protein